jgi:hypothetical protein
MSQVSVRRATIKQKRISGVGVVLAAGLIAALGTGAKAFRRHNRSWKAESTNTLFAGGYWGCRLGDVLLNEVPRETIVETDFARGTAAQYRMIIDSNSSILDNDTIDQIKRWVRAGEIFVTYLQTGRHTSSNTNAWLSSRLTGYTTTAIDEIDRLGDYIHPRKMHLVPGQQVFKGEGPEWADLKGAGTYP